MRLSILIIFVVILFLSLSTANAEDFPQYHPDYPGNGANDSHFYVGMQSVKLGVFYFHKVFERWPDSWQEVKDSGIFQADIPGFDMQPLDPDNPELTEYGQIYYEPASDADSNPVIHTAVYIGGFKIRSEPANGYMPVYRIQFRDYDADLTDKMETEFRYSKYMDDEDQLKQFAILGIMFSNINLFRTIKGRLPNTMQEFMASGMSPVDENSINPVTGQPFRFDGSVGDVLYKITDDGNFILRHIEENESPFGFSY